MAHSLTRRATLPRRRNGDGFQFRLWSGQRKAGESDGQRRVLKLATQSKNKIKINRYTAGRGRDGRRGRQAGRPLKQIFILFRPCGRRWRLSGRWWRRRRRRRRETLGKEICCWFSLSFPFLSFPFVSFPFLSFPPLPLCAATRARVPDAGQPACLAWNCKSTPHTFAASARATELLR
ncbi:hypothetical protein LZ31DRAFT_206668 [Colletotrichum somersetense]|nr:hypothetical protein LZ31DRAFT_206668 [Colletotrichum somersetense]